MNIEATCPYCNTDFIIELETKGMMGTSTQACPNCQANIDTQLLLALASAQRRVSKIQPKIHRHTK